MAKRTNKQPKVDANKILASLSRGVKTIQTPKNKELEIKPEEKIEFNKTGTSQVEAEEEELEDEEEELLEDMDDEEAEEPEEEDEEEEEEPEKIKPNKRAHKTVTIKKEVPAPQPVDKRVLLARFTHMLAGQIAFEEAESMAKFYQAHGIKGADDKFIAMMTAQAASFRSKVKDLATTIWMKEIATWFEPILKAEGKK